MNNKSLEEQRLELQSNNKEKYIYNKIYKKFEITAKTIMIGAIADLEEFFGELWGHGKKPEERTLDEIEEYKNFQAARESILDRGNKGIKIFKKELDRCHIDNYDERPYKAIFKKTGE